MRKLTFFFIPMMCSLLMAADDKGAKMTGCLTKDASGEYVLANEAGERVIVKGASDLEKHSANHKVTLHGAQKTEDGKVIFQAEHVQHVANSCVATPAK
jgi:exonuclease VII large subunit